MIKHEERIRYIATATQPHRGEDCFQPQCCNSCLPEEENVEIQKFASYKLRNVDKRANFYSYFSNHMGTWHVKGIHGYTYILVTTGNYPDDVAIECLDEFSETYERVSQKWFEKRRGQAQTACCQAIFDKYSSLEVETAPWVLMHQIDAKSRREYSKSVKNLFQKIESLQKQMDENIKRELENMERAEDLQELAQDCVEKAQVFRKKAKKVRWKAKMKNSVFNAKGAVVCAALGGAVGFLAGGPSGALLLTSMSVAEAQAIEASVAAFVFGVGYYAAQSKVECWSWSQPILVL